LVEGDPGDGDLLVARGPSPEETELAAGTAQLARQETKQFFVGGVVHRWRGDPQLELRSQGPTQFGPGSPRLDAESEYDFLAQEAEVIGH
jgi:hypothetical protein